MTVSPLSEITDVSDRPTIGDVAELVRSKNAGPFWQTLDVFLPDDDTYWLVAESPAVNEATISALYGAPVDSITIYRLPTIRVVKVSFPRPTSQGTARAEAREALTAPAVLVNFLRTYAARCSRDRRRLVAAPVSVVGRRSIGVRCAGR